MNKKSKKRAKASRKRRQWLIGAGLSVLVFLGTWLSGLLSGAMEHLVPVDPVADKVVPGDGVKVEDVLFDRFWPMAFDDSAKAENYVRQINAGNTDGVPAGGVPAVPSTTVVFTLRGNREQTVRITDIRLEPLEELPPIRTALVCPLIEKGGGGDLEMLDFNLDNKNPVAHAMNEDGKVTGTPYFRKRMVTLAKGESVGFMLQFDTTQHHVRFNITVEYKYGSHEHGSVKIDDQGKPFEFTALQRKESGRLWLVDSAGTHVNEVDPRNDNTPVGNCKP